MEITPWWKTAILAADIFFGLLAAFSAFMLIQKLKKGKAAKQESACGLFEFDRHASSSRAHREDHVLFLFPGKGAVSNKRRP